LECVSRHAQVVGVDSYHRPRQDAPARPPQGECAFQETTDKRAPTRRQDTITPTPVPSGPNSTRSHKKGEARNSKGGSTKQQGKHDTARRATSRPLTGFGNTAAGSGEHGIVACGRTKRPKPQSIWSHETTRRAPVTGRYVPVRKRRVSHARGGVHARDKGITCCGSWAESYGTLQN
jgi:hypothetical protein